MHWTRSRKSSQYDLNNKARVALLLSLVGLDVCKAFRSCLPSNLGRLPMRKRSPFITQQPTTDLFIRSSSRSSSRNQKAFDSSDDSFDWKQAWYPLAPVQDLNQKAPTKLTILGMDLVVWYHEDSLSWRVVRDLCPHRLVPLSEGRVENSVLQCAYHGWEFDQNGSCVRIPQLVEPLKETMTNKKACAASAFPTKVAQGLLWVFPMTSTDNGGEVKDLADSIPLPLIPELDNPDMIDATNFFVRDMPYSWEILVENLCDPSHIPFAHHAMMNGADRYNPPAVNLKLVGNESANGFCASKDPAPEVGTYELVFRPPCLLYYTIDDGKTYIGLGQYCVPTEPGKCRLLARFPFRLSIKPAMAVIRRTPRWVTHMSQNLVMDSDVVFLCAQDDYLQQQQKSPANYYMPARCDVAVAAFRRWLKRYQGPEWLGIPCSRSQEDPSGRRPPAKSGRDSLLDRFRQHTDSCTACRGAHRKLLWLSKALNMTAVFALAVAANSQKRRRFVLFCVSAVFWLIPQGIIHPLVLRLEGMTWPRSQWSKTVSKAD